MQIGTRLKYRATGTIFEIRNITNQFMILHSLDGLTQLVIEKKNSTFLFEFEEFNPIEPTAEDSGRNN
jgi:hypothetical protein